MMMIIEYSLPLLLLCSSVLCLKLNETATRLDGNDSETESNVFQKTRDNSRNKLLETKIVTTKLTRSNFTETSVNLNEIVDIWNPYTLMEHWNRDIYEALNITENCAKDMTDYLTGLSMGEKWALKTTDATGKYTWGLLSENMFWIGATDQCREMESEHLKWRKDGRIERKSDVPPFRVSVNSVSLVLNISRTELNGSYDVMIGVCLPYTCDYRDVEKLFYFLQDQTRSDLPSDIDVQRIRNMSKGYSFWDDSVFYALLVTFVVVLIAVHLGTIYDIALRYRALRSKGKKNLNGTTTEMKIGNGNGDVDDVITISKLWSTNEHNGSIDVNKSRDAPKPLMEALLSFSLLVNLSKLCSLDVGADILAPIHGLRFFSMIWVILVHTCLTINVVSEARTFRSTAESNFLYQTISNGTYAVDTFFVISGCLVSFLYFRTIAKDGMKKMKITRGCHGRIFQFLGMMWYRYFRLTPPYLLVIGIIQVSSSWYYDHTLLDLYTIDYDNCRKFWWRNILYINTYFDMDERCIVWSWYLANDTQFYTFGIIILIIGASFLPVAAFLAIFCVIASWITTATVALQKNHVISIQDPFANYDSLYDKPWSRIGPYLIGMMVGWYLCKNNCKLKINKVFVGVYWILSVITMLTVVYGLYGNKFGPFFSAMYTALSHSVWAISVAWILIACVTGYGGLINQVLSWKYLFPLSRLSYCTYLIHPLIMRAITLQGESSMHLTQGFMAMLFFGFVVASYAVSFFISLFFEAPVVSLLRIVHPLRRWKNAK